MDVEEARLMVKEGLGRFQKMAPDRLAHIIGAPYEVADAIQIAFDEYLTDNPDVVEKMATDYIKRME